MRPGISPDRFSVRPRLIPECGLLGCPRPDSKSGPIAGRPLAHTATAEDRQPSLRRARPTYDPLDSGIRFGSSACSGEPGEAVADEVNAHPGDPGSRDTSKSLSREATMICLSLASAL